jgi:outer membrane protein OmpA-like peptidoglycan-associated protein
MSIIKNNNHRKGGNVMDYQSKFIVVLILLSFIFIGSVHAQVEEIPSAAQEMEEAVPVEPPAAPPAKKSAEAYTSATQEVDKAVMLYQELKTNGHVILEGIHFDKGKADLEMESDTCLKVIAKMLTDHPEMKIYLVSHTDNKGHMINQMRLSQQRSAAVMNSLTDRFGIDMDRMFASGVGPLCPLATNETDEGHAQNERVELVLQ